MNQPLKLKRLDERAILPTIGNPNDACYDLSSIEYVDFLPGEIKLVRTGWSIEPPDGYRINVYVRSSTPLKKKYVLANGVGIVDHCYRGEIYVALMNVSMSPEVNSIKPGERIAQFEIVKNTPAQSFPIEVVDELSETVRGTGGFGSTGS